MKLKLTPARNPINPIRQITSLLFLSGALCLQAIAGNETWTGAAGDNNWNTAGNWAGDNKPPVAGDIISFGAQGAGGLTLNNNLTVDTALLGLDFNATAPSFVLAGNEIAPTGAIIDNSLNLQTINLPITTTVTNNIGAASGSTLVIGGVISGAGGGINKISGGTVTLNKNNTYTGGTTISAGTLTLDYTGAATSIIPSTSSLTLGGGALNVIGNGSAASSQTFAATTINAGGSMVSAAPVSGANLPTVALGNITYNTGGTIEFIGPAYNNAPTTASGQASTGLQAATANITTTTAANNGLLRGTATPITAIDATYGTVGLYDVAGLNGSTVVGASQLANPGGLGTAGDGYYTIVNAGAIPTGSHDNQIIDVIGACTSGGSSTINYAGLRFNSPGGSVHVSYWTSVGIILVTPNVGATNVPISVTAVGVEPAERNGSDPGSIVIWQNDILGLLSCDALIDGKVAGGVFVKDGQGTFISTGAYTGQGYYTGQTYVNNGVWQIYGDSGVGAVATGAQVNLNGGTLLGAATLTLDNAGANIRPIALGSNGGGLAAVAGTTMTVDGVISGAAPLTIGIPASSANNYTAGLVPGTGAGTANTATNASGTVVLTGANTYTGNTIVSSGTLQLGATGVILSTNIITSPGGTYDVSLISGYTLNGGYNLMGGGAVNGSVNAASGSGIYGGTDGTYGTNTFNNNLTLASGAAVYFDLGASATGPNDQIVVNGNLTFNGNVIHLKAPSTAALLDMAFDYTLFSSPNLITVASTPTIVWDVPPANWPKYILVVAGNTVRLHYVASPGPFIVSSSALPNPAYDNENILISAMVMTNGSTLKSITVDASQIAGTAPGTTILTLVSTGTANPTIYTNSVTVGAAVPIGTVTYYSTAIDNANITFLATNTLSIISGVPVMSGVTAVPNPVSPGQLVTVTATVVGYSYPISSVTVTGSAINGSPLTLVSSNGTSVYTNSATAVSAGVLTVTGTDSANETVTTNLTLNLMDIWSGDGSHNYWDLTSANWVNGGPKYAFANGDGVTFNNNGSVSPPLNINATVVPSSVLVSSTTRNYVFTGSGSISGSTGLTKTNGSTLTILNTNSYTGPTVIYGGVLELQTNALLISGAPSAIGAASSSPANLVFNGSTLRYSGSDTNVTDHGMTIVGGMAVDVTNPVAVFTDTGVVTGSGGATNALAKLGQGMLVLQSVNSYAGGTVISNGTLAMGNNNANWNGGTGSGLGSITNTVTFVGTNGILQLYGWLGYTSYTTAFNNFTNPLVIPAGQVGTLQLPGRGNPATGAGAGLNSSLTGSGTLNLVANYVRYPLSGNWSGFTGQINVTGAGFPNVNNNTVGAVTADIDELRFNYTNYANAAFYLYGSTAPGNQNSPQSTLVMCQTVASGATIDIGELGCDPSTPTPIIGTGTGSAGNTTWRVGWKNTTNIFYGVIANDSQTGVGVSSITKVGTGKWVLAGVNTYGGSTTVSNGVLALITNPNTYNDASIANSANIFIATNAVLDLSGLSSPMLTLNAGQVLGGQGTLVGSVTANSGANLNPGSSAGTGALTITGGLTESGGVNNNFQLTNVSPNVINVQGDLNVSSGTQNINLSGFGTNTIAPGTYPLFTYTGNLYGALNNFFVSFGAYAYTGTLTNITTTTPQQIAVIVGSPTRAGTNDVWKGDGVANNWDTVGKDWLLGAGTVASTYQSGDSVIFNDVGAANTNVTLQSALYPASVVLSNSTLVSYTLTGSGNITGTIGLLKTNSGTVTMLATNTYTGPTVIGGGKLAVVTLPSGGVASPIGASSNNSTNLLFTGGTLAYIGPGESTARGAMLIGSGGAIDVIPGSSLTNTGIIGGSGVLIKTNGGTLWLNAGNTNTGNIVINGGVLSDAIGENNNYPALGGLGNPMVAGRTVTINNGGILSLDATGGNEFGGGGVTNLLGYIINPGGLMRITSGNATIGPVTLNGGTMDVYAGASTTNQWGAFEFTGDITVGGTTPSTIQSEVPCFYNLTAGSLVPYRTFNVTSSVLNVTATLGDSGSTIQHAGLIKTGAGMMMLSATNAYTGNTLVSNGVLLVNGWIVSGTNNGSVTVSGGTLGGYGTIGGAVTVQSGGTLAPGAGTNVAGTVLTLNSNLTVQTGGTVQMQVSHSANDSITCSGTITYGGMLMISTNAGDATPYQVGDTFYLFNLGVASGTYGAGSSFVTIQPPPGPGLGWSGSSLTTDGSIQVVTASPVVAGLTAGPTTGVAPLAVTFTNTSTGASYWVWNFGDGSTLSTNANANVAHTYASIGSYTVTLTAYGTGGMSALTNTAYVVVLNPAPVAGFSGTPTNIFVGQGVKFTDASTGSITNWVWSFGDGHSVTNTSSISVTNVYAAVGTYTVSLTVTGSGGTGTSTRTSYVTVKPKTALGGVTLAGGKLVFSGANGPAGQQYRILTAANVALPLASWTPVWTNVFAADGSYSYTNTLGTNAASYFLLVSP